MVSAGTLIEEVSAFIVVSLGAAAGGFSGGGAWFCVESVGALGWVLVVSTPADGA